MKNLIAWFKDEEGQGMVEYGILIGFIAIGVIAILVFMGPKIVALFERTNTGLDDVPA